MAPCGAAPIGQQCRKSANTQIRKNAKTQKRKSAKVQMYECMNVCKCAILVFMYTSVE